MPLIPFLNQLVSKRSLSSDQARAAMMVLLEGQASEVQISAFLVALKMKGEAASELAGLARAMREKMVVVDCGDDVIDTAGTGGDQSGTFNISTAAAIVMAGAGAKVAKHGNRSLSSSSGSADVLEALGVRISMTPDEAAEAVREIGLGFLFAPALHPAMKFAQPVRKDLKLRTVFNLLGPLANPARARFQVIGAPSDSTSHLIAQALVELGTKRSFVVHGHDGLDEVSTTGYTAVWEVTGSILQEHVWSPTDFGLPMARLSDLQGGSPQDNAGMIQEILAGKPSPARDITVANAAAGLLAGGLVSTLFQGVSLSQQAIDSGAAREKLALLAEKYPVA